MGDHEPSWFQHAVFYEIFPDRFARGAQKRDIIVDTATLEPWEAAPTAEGYKGGDLWGVIDRLDYLEELGINAIYFTPLFQSTANHRYHTHDYYQIDPLLGGNDAFAELLKAAHRRDIRILIDGVFNHCGRGFFFFNDVLENGIASPWVNWFTIKSWPLAAYDRNRPVNYACWNGKRTLPQFNHGNPAVREYLMRVAEYWTEKGIDGWRLDSPDSIQTTGFWQEFCERIKAINPEAYLLGEVVPSSDQRFVEGYFDGVMNYRFRRHTIIFAAGSSAASIRPEHLRPRGDIPAPLAGGAAYAERMRDLLNLFPCDDRYTQLNLLASHDTARPITTLGGDRVSLELATLLLLTFPGAPCIYYGDEVGLPGGPKQDCRRSFPAEAQWDQDILAFHRKLIALRHAHPALRGCVPAPPRPRRRLRVCSRVLWRGAHHRRECGHGPREIMHQTVREGRRRGIRLCLENPTREVLYGSAELPVGCRGGVASPDVGIAPPRRDDHRSRSRTLGPLMSCLDEDHSSGAAGASVGAPSPGGRLQQVHI